mgnify:CR=1 FL=1
MRYRIDYRALRPYSIALLCIGIAGMASAPWITKRLPLPSRIPLNPIEFVFGLAAGLGLGAVIGSFATSESAEGGE